MKVDTKQAQENLQAARALRSLSETPGWAVLRDRLEKGQQARRARLANINCDEEQTRRLRVELVCFEILLRSAMVQDQDIAYWEQWVAFGRNQEKILERLGLTQTEQEQTHGLQEQGQVR